MGRRSKPNRDTTEYDIWKQMKQRCFNSRCAAYKYYGARGITVCKEWIESFDTFLKDMGFRPEGLSIERIDNDGNYEPSNCKWATTAEQNRNQQKHRKNKDNKFF